MGLGGIPAGLLKSNGDVHTLSNPLGHVMSSNLKIRASIPEFWVIKSLSD